MIRRALISVSDKTGLAELAAALARRNIEILSSGGTAKFLKEKGCKVTEVSEFTGAPEMLDGRLKTLHPKIHGGILAVRDNRKQMEEIEQQGYLPIDLVVVNLYPFEEAARSEKAFMEVVEQIDIGGPTLLRAAAKNFPFVTVLLEPAQYPQLVDELNQHNGDTTLEFRKSAARRVFERTAAYDSVISGFFQRELQEIPDHYSIALEKKWPMRYGENPHQPAGFYLPAAALGNTVLDKVLQGKQLSYNNLLDIHAALDLIVEFDSLLAVAILKHTNPCGVGISKNSLREAYSRALECDPVSAFGGIVVFSETVDGKTAATCSETFTEIVIAPAFDSEARKIFEKKKNLRLLEVNLREAKKALEGYEIRRAADGYLVQHRDRSMENLQSMKVVTQKQPTEDQYEALFLAWKVSKHVKSNAIVLANLVQTVGIGAGQMSRVDSTKFAALKAGADRTKGCVLASDAFFPFRDSIDEVAMHGIRAIVQPGGSMRDQEVIDAANQHGIAMIFTDVRHFKH